MLAFLFFLFFFKFQNKLTEPVHVTGELDGGPLVHHEVLADGEELGIKLRHLQNTQHLPKKKLTKI